MMRSTGTRYTYKPLTIIITNKLIYWFLDKAKCYLQLVTIAWTWKIRPEIKIIWGIIVITIQLEVNRSIIPVAQLQAH